MHSRIIHNWQDMDTTYLFINRWIDKDYVGCACVCVCVCVCVYPPLGFFSAMRKDLLPFATWIDLEGISELSQMEEDKQYDIIYMWNLQKQNS